MNQKELGELRRRLRPDKCAIKCIYGCYVNGNKELSPIWTNLWAG